MSRTRRLNYHVSKISENIVVDLLVKKTIGEMIGYNEFRFDVYPKDSLA